MTITALRLCQVIHKMDELMEFQVAEEDRAKVLILFVRGYRGDTGQRIVRPEGLEESVCIECRKRSGDCCKTS